MRIYIQRPHFITLHVQCKVHFKPAISRFSYWPTTSVNISDESVTSAACVLARHLADEQRLFGSGCTCRAEQCSYRAGRRRLVLSCLKSHESSHIANCFAHCHRCGVWPTESYHPAIAYLDLVGVMDNQNVAFKFLRLTAPQLAIQHPLLTQVCHA